MLEKIDIKELPEWVQQYISLCKPNEQLEDNGFSKQVFNAWSKWLDNNGIKSQELNKDGTATFTCEYLD